jgi:hypothetical protein
MFKTITTAILFILLFSLSACANEKQIDGITYGTFGIFNLNEQNPKIRYKLVAGNCIWGALLSETIIAPIYFFGFSIYEPIGKISEAR